MDSSEHGAQRPIKKSRSIDGVIKSGPHTSLGHSKIRTASSPPTKLVHKTIHDPEVKKSVAQARYLSSMQNYSSYSPPPRIPNVKDQELRDRKHIRKHKHNNRLLYRRLAASFLSIVLVMMVSGGGWIGWKFLKNTSKVFGGSIVSNIGELFSTTKIKGEDRGRVNILLAGDSADDPNHAGAQLTDSIMVVSVDLKNNSAVMLSIPRDLWVYVPTFGQQKINAANEVSSFNSPGYPKGGMGQLEEILSSNLGIPVDYYALIDYTAFKDAVNAIGGITVNIQSPDPRGLYDPNISAIDGGPLKLANGVQTLNGQTALNLARARGDPAPSGIPSYGFPQSDFNRTEHQRQELIALKSKAESLGVVSNPLKIGQLFDAIGNNVQTDLNLADILRLVQLTKGVGNNSIQSLSLSETGTNALLTGYYSPSGQDALIPKAGLNDFSQIRAYWQHLTSSNPVVKENASVVVLNGTTTSGVAKKVETNLANKGINVSNIGDSSKSYTTTIIIDNSNGKDPATLDLLKQSYGNNVTTKQLEIDASNPTFIVIIGSDRATSI